MNYGELMQAAREFGVASRRRKALAGFFNLKIGTDGEPLESVPPVMQDDKMPEWDDDSITPENPSWMGEVSIAFVGGSLYGRFELGTIGYSGRFMDAAAAVKMGVIVSALVDAAMLWHDAYCDADKPASSPTAV